MVQVNVSGLPHVAEWLEEAAIELSSGAFAQVGEGVYNVLVSTLDVTPKTANSNFIDGSRVWYIKSVANDSANVVWRITVTS